ncbi:hypothetical protein ABUE34_11525 [Kozakia baliensis]|uniref:hypothetical protein n=1 Tax=Kozakia baliensis TaxID=153496 RepID=UPI00345B9A44
MWAWWSEMLRDPTKVGLVAAWFTGGAALVGVVISAAVSTIVSRRAVYINAVTSERSKWIEALRDTISNLSAAADRVVTLRQAKAADYAESVEWATDTQEMHRLVTDLVLRLNPTEPEALNLLKAARKLNAAARLHSSAAVMLADEVMVRHAQWVLKAEWERVKEEAAGWSQALRFRYRRWRRRSAYNRFLLRDGSLEKLDAIGAGKTDLELTLLRSQMDVA